MVAEPANLDFTTTDGAAIPQALLDNVYEGLGANAAREVHVFGRRGPAQAKFTPLELKELDHSPTIEVVIDPEDIDYDAASESAWIRYPEES